MTTGALVPARTQLHRPGRLHTQLQQWLALVNGRRRRVLGCAPTERIGSDKAAMLALPPVAPETGWRASTRLARDHYLRIDSSDYSIHSAVIGRRIELVVDLHRVRALFDGRLVADHERVWAWHQTLSDPDHLARPGCCAANASECCSQLANPKSSSARSVTTTPRSASTTAWTSMAE